MIISIFRKIMRGLIDDSSKFINTDDSSNEPHNEESKDIPETDVGKYLQENEQAVDEARSIAALEIEKSRQMNPTPFRGPSRLQK